jgi:hypothetical protein
MKTYPTAVVKASIKAFTLNSLTAAQADFAAKPSCDNWNTAVRAMLVHQQAAYLSDAQFEVLRTAMIKDLDEAIVMTVTGKDIETVLRATNAA